jgi:hypothetical protein
MVEQTSATATIPVPTATATPEPTAVATPTAVPTATPTGPRVVIGGVAFDAEVADTSAKRVRGLSGRESLPEQTGMLFVFEFGSVSSFWMKGMRFPLDFVWIGSECVVADVTENVPNPAPDTADALLPLYRPDAPSSFAFEIKAGEIEALGIEVGDEVIFEGIESENAYCR